MGLILTWVDFDYPGIRLFRKKCRWVSSVWLWWFLLLVVSEAGVETGSGDLLVAGRVFVSLMGKQAAQF
jgi:hypothetical protein